MEFVFTTKSLFSARLSDTNAILHVHIVALALVCALVASASGCVKQTNAVKLPTQEEDTTLGPGDVFDVRVYNEKELSAEYQVSPDGTASFPFIGVLTVAGKDTTTIAREISSKLENGGYLKSPYVSVLLHESKSKRYSVLGAVAKPGTMPLTPGMTIVQAVSQAGGFTPLANKDGTVVTRRSGDKLERFQIPMTDIARGNADDFALRSGDIVFVPERLF